MEKSRLRKMIESFRENRELIVRTWLAKKEPEVRWLMKPPPPSYEELASNEITFDMSELEASCVFNHRIDRLGRRYIEVTIEGYSVWADPMHFIGDWTKKPARDIDGALLPAPPR